MRGHCEIWLTNPEFSETLVVALFKSMDWVMDISPVDL